jgi:hypothetical protein
VLQCWLDVRDFGARGEEQAEEILNRLNLHG